MFVRITKQYRDIQTKFVYPEDVIREVSDERGTQLIKAGVAMRENLIAQPEPVVPIEEIIVPVAKKSSEPIVETKLPVEETTTEEKVEKGKAPNKEPKAQK